MSKDSFRHHRATKARHRDDILRILRTKPSTFTELLQATKLSRPTLTLHLQELTRAKIVEHNDETRIYSLTERGKTWELVGTRVLSAGLVAAGGIAQDPKGAQLLEDMAKMAKQNPEFLKVIMNWGLDLLLFFASDPFYESRALKAWGGDKESWALIQAEIDRRTASIHPRTIEEFKVALDDVRTVIIKSLETERRRRGK